MGENGTVVDGKEEKRVSLWGARVKRRRRKGNGGWPGSGEIKMRREKGEFFGNGRLIGKEIEERG